MPLVRLGTGYLLKDAANHLEVLLKCEGEENQFLDKTIRTHCNEARDFCPRKCSKRRRQKLSSV